MIEGAAVMTAAFFFSDARRGVRQLEHTFDEKRNDESSGFGA